MFNCVFQLYGNLRASQWEKNNQIKTYVYKVLGESIDKVCVVWTIYLMRVMKQKGRLLLDFPKAWY